MTPAILKIVSEEARRLFRSWADVEDAQQEGLLKILRLQADHIGELTPPYIRIAVRNHFLDILRKRKRREDAEAQVVLGSSDERSGEKYEQAVAEIGGALPKELQPLFLELAMPSPEVIGKSGKAGYHLVARRLGWSMEDLQAKLEELQSRVQVLVKGKA